jgi:hypothetical protein
MAFFIVTTVETSNLTSARAGDLFSGQAGNKQGGGRPIELQIGRDCFPPHSCPNHLKMLNHAVDGIEKVKFFC